MKKRVLATALTFVVILAVSVVAFAETLSPDAWDVVFTEENKLESNYTAAEVSSKVYEMQPGDTVLLKLNLSNDNSKPANWYMSNAVLQSLEASSDRASGGAYEYELIYTDPSGAENVLYTSDSVGGELANSDRVGLENATEGLEDYLYLDTLAAGAKATVELRVSLDGETQGNSYQDTLARLQINFAVDPVVTREEVETRTDSNVVRTGDQNKSLPFLIVAGISGLLLLILAILSMRERKGANQAARKALSLLLVGALVCASPALSMAARAAEDDGSGRDGLTYTVRLYPGAQGSIVPNSIVSVYAGEGRANYQPVMENGVCVLRDLPYGTVVTFHTDEETEGGVVLNSTETADSKYYVRGVRESGQDNSTVGQSAISVTGDMDYVVAYGIRGEMVAYTVRFEDEAGNELAPPLVRHGNIGDKPVVAYQYIEGYRPQAYNLAKTLSANAEENVFTFTYQPIDVNVTVLTTYVPGVTTVEAAPGVEAPAPAGPGGEEIPEDDTPLTPTPDEVIDLDETPLAPGGSIFDPVAELFDEFATALVALPMAVRLGLSVCIAGLGAWIILLFVRKKKDKDNDAKAS